MIHYIIYYICVDLLYAHCTIYIYKQIVKGVGEYSMKHGMMISLKEPVYRSLSWSTIQTQRITQQKQVL